MFFVFFYISIVHIFIIPRHLLAQRPKPPLGAISSTLSSYKSLNPFIPPGKPYQMEDEHPQKYFISGTLNCPHLSRCVPVRDPWNVQCVEKKEGFCEHFKTNPHDVFPQDSQDTCQIPASCLAKATPPSPTRRWLSMANSRDPRKQREKNSPEKFLQEQSLWRDADCHQAFNETTRRR